MSYHLDDTIAAVATASGGAARGMVRVSGPGAVAVVARCFQTDDRTSLDQLRQSTAVPGRLFVGRTILSVTEQTTDRIVRPTDGGGQQLVVPCDLFVWPTSRSYTRQPVVELHTPGSPPLLAAVLVTVCRAGARLAEPGEFTLRAFLAGRLDLTQAEAVLGVIDAASADELSLALQQLAGGLTRPLHRLRDDLLQLLAELEAGLDFVEEEIEFISPEELLMRLDGASGLLGDVAEQMASRHTTDQAQQIALVGAPNVGKSSLFNALVARRGIVGGTNQQRPSTALVSPRRGTTRDYLTATIQLDGIRCELVDTAGVDRLWKSVEGSTRNRPTPRRGEGVPRVPTAHIDAAAQALATECSTRAAIRAWCVDASESDFNTRGFAGKADCDVVVLTKSDLAPHPACLPGDSPSGVPTVVTSSRTGKGLDELCAALRTLLMRDATAQHGHVVAATADRCRESIRLAEAALRSAADVVKTRSGDELVAAEIRTALAELGKIVGAVYTDDLLDRIFSSFCIGK